MGKFNIVRCDMPFVRSIARNQRQETSVDE